MEHYYITINGKYLTKDNTLTDNISSAHIIRTNTELAKKKEELKDIDYTICSTPLHNGFIGLNGKR